MHEMMGSQDRLFDRHNTVLEDLEDSLPQQQGRTDES